MQVGIVGLGAMGLAMAGHVKRAGHAVTGLDTDAARLEAAREAGLGTAAGLDEIAARAEAILVVVATDAQCRSVVEALLAAGPQPGCVIAVAATTHPRTMIDLGAACAERGTGLIDAPVCYGLKGAQDGDLVSLCGGAEADIATLRPVLEAYSRSVEHLGPLGAGQLGKTCNNMMHWAACVANYEVLALARSCGLDAQAMRETLLKCPARNTTLERWDTTRFTWHEKDLDVALELSQQAGLSLPLFGAVDQLVKRLGPDRVRELLHEDKAEYLGLPITARPLSEVTRQG
ncbi:NAD(P)-dependent oxidoreductase [Roseivivax sp. CAU 1761]